MPYLEHNIGQRENKVDIKNNRRINKTKSWFFETVNKIDKSLASLMEKKRERTQIKNLTLLFTALKKQNKPNSNLA